MKRRLEVWTIALAGGLAGLGVGVADGLRAAAVAALGPGDGLVAVALVAGLDALVGLALGLLGAAIVACARWGRGAGAVWSSAVSWLIAGLLEAAVVGGALLATGSRKNRFIAGLVVAAVATCAALVLALVAPALGRLLSWPGPARRRGSPAGGGPTCAPFGTLVLAPLLLGLAGVIVVQCALKAAFPVRLGSINLRLAALAAAPVPFLLATLAPRRLVRAGWLGFGALGIVLVGGPAIWVVRQRWISDFRFVPWRDLSVAVALCAGAAAISVGLRRRGHAPGRRRALGALLSIGIFAAVIVLAAARAEPARKVAAHVGVAGLVLTQARGALDFDHDGYARWLGGGDCDDGDPLINPMAKDWPDDGVDQDCDGKDARFDFSLSPPFHAVPSTVPRDLNVLLVTIDTLRADHLGCYGYGRPTSPELDRLAQDGTLFENAWAHAPSTRYSMPAIALSRWPSTIDWNMAIWWPGMGPDQRTIGEAFKAQGYVTGAFYAYEYFQRSAARGFERGIDFYEDRLAARHMNVGGDPAHSVGTSGAEMADDAIHFLSAQKDGKWFLWVHFYDPHLEYQKHPGIDFGDTQADLYDAEVRFTDQQLGRVIDELRRLGLYERTAILVTGDHGEGLGEHPDEHGAFGHGYRLYSQVTKVPLVARVPGIAPRKVRTPVGHVDIAPTLLNVVRGTHESSFLGRSMIDVMQGLVDDPRPEPVFQDFGYEGPTEWRGLVDDRFHLIWNVVPHNTRECYDHAADPQEDVDLWGRAAGRPCEVLREQLEQKVKRLQLGRIAGFVSSPGGPAPLPSHARQAQLGKTLRYLGYDLSSELPTRAAGATLAITHHFEVLERPPEGWRLFFHLEGPGGLHLTLDHPAVRGEYPLERWQRGQKVRDRQIIELPPSVPPGEYALYVGLWRGADRQAVTPQALGDDKGRLRAVTFTLR